MNRTSRVAAVATTTLAVLGAAALAVGSHARASVIETQMLAIDATHCDLITDGPIMRMDWQVKGSSGSAYRLRCPLEFPSSPAYPTTITSLRGSGFWNAPGPVMPAAQPLNFAVYRRDLASTTRSLVVQCQANKPADGYNVPATCTQATSHVVDDTQAIYSIDIWATNWSTRWGASGAVITYTWEHAP